MTTTGPTAYIFSPSVPAGNLTVQEVVPRGFGTPIVYCYVVSDGQIVRPWLQYPVSEDTIQIENLVTPEIAYCGWFNLPTENSVQIDTIAYACPAGFDVNLAEYEALVVACGSPATQIEFTLLTGAGSYLEHTANGLVSFPGVASGDVTLQEAVPAGHGRPKVYCAVYGPDGQTFRSRDLYFVSNEGGVEVDALVSISSVLCEFFNVPAGVNAPMSQPIAGSDLTMRAVRPYTLAFAT